jgi:hypothetical protein
MMSTRASGLKRLNWSLIPHQISIALPLVYSEDLPFALVI